LDKQLRVGEADLVAHGRAEHLGVLAAGHFHKKLKTEC
jgi:hypothetical protein